MKKIILAISVIVFLVSSCGKKELENKIITQQKLNDSIQAIIVSKDNEIESLFQDLNSIEQSLSEVSSKYGNVNKLKNTSGEISKDSRAKITAQIQDINELLNSNRQKLNNINGKLKADGNKRKELAAFVETLQAKVTEQEAQIQALTTELQNKKIVIENLNKNINDLSQQNQAKDQQILQVETEKNTAYYIVGLKKVLQADGIVSSTGGFLGMGKKTLVSSDSDLSKYTKVDIRKINEIPLEGKRMKIMTTHPSSSYSIEGDVKAPTSIKIKDRNAFWGKSKFLVVMYN
ncbi:MAG: hypothetical protein WC679_05990 [Bacteroidales bacterium]|jgi:chromosome segregation ATPase